MRHSFFEAEMYCANLVAFTDKYVRTEYFDNDKSENLSKWFVESVKHSIEDMESVAKDAKDKDQYIPIIGARLLFLGKVTDKAIETTNAMTTSENREFKEALKTKAYHILKIEKGVYEIAVRLFPRNGHDSLKPDSRFNDKIIKGCTTCHGIIKSKYSYSKVDLAGAMIIKYEVNKS